MITKELFSRRIKEKKVPKDNKELVDYIFPVVEYWLKHEANIELASQMLGVQTHTSKINFLPIDPENEKKRHLLVYAFNEICKKY